VHAELMAHTEFLTMFENQQDHLILDSSLEGKSQLRTSIEHLFQCQCWGSGDETNASHTCGVQQCN